MAVSAATVWDWRDTASGSMINGGGFVTGATGVDYSQQNAAQYALTGLASAGAGNVVLSAAAAADMVGNIAHCLSGTNFTAGWFEILSVSVGVSITFGTNQAGASILTGVGANGVINIGGSLNAGALENTWATQVVNGNKVWIKSGTYALAASMTFSDLTGNIGGFISGYQAARGDNPQLAARPLFNLGGQNFSLGQGFIAQYLQFVGTTAANASTASGTYKFCKFVNNSTTVGRNALTLGGGTAIACEAISYRGFAVAANANPLLDGCYIHDSMVGLNIQTNSQFYMFNTLIESCGSSAFSSASATAVPCMINNCTFFGSINKRGIGISMSNAGFANMIIKNSILYGFTTGIFHSSVVSAVSACVESNNNYFNNSADVSGWNKDNTSIALDPQFAGVGQIVGSNATSNGTLINDPTLTLSGIIPNQDFCLVIGSSVVPGQYLITAFTANTLTLSPAIGSSLAPVSYQITTGRNFGVGTNMKGVGVPGNFGGTSVGLSFSYNDLGAVQRQEAGGGAFTFTG